MAKRHIFLLGTLCLLAAASLLFRVRSPGAAETQAVQPARETPKLIALTFDDGPRRDTTARLLDGLQARGVHATFFLIGAQIPDHQDLVLRMEEEGHEIGIHTFDHVALTGLNRADFDAQVGRTRRLLEPLLGRTDFPLRPPYGKVDDAVERLAEAPIVLWSVDPEDWHNRDAGREAKHIVEHARDGAIVLLHDFYPQSVDAALEAVDALLADGYVFLTFSELCGARGVVPQPGTVYRHLYPGDTDFAGYGGFSP